MRPICVPCQRFFRPEKNGVSFIEGMPLTVPACGAEEAHSARPGFSEAQHWKPYKLWSGDLWKCPGYGTEVIAGTGKNPIVEHYQEDFEYLMEMRAPQFRVNDC